MVSAAVFLGCGRDVPVSPAAGPAVAKSSSKLRAEPVAPPPAARPPEVVPRFVSVAAEAGIDFTFYSDTVPGRFFLPEVMGGGAAWLDVDQDGRLDLYLMNGCRLPTDPEQTEHVNRLYLGRADGRFADATALAGADHNGYGQGCGAGDFDADGFPDLYLTNFGDDVLLRNNGDGTYADVTTTAGVSDPLWGSSVVWFDADDDADLDLYVVNYLDVRYDNARVCIFNELPGYCGPGEYAAVPDRLYLNGSDGTFTEALEELGLSAPDGKGLAVVAADFDLDLRPDLYVGNDMEANFLFTRSRNFLADSSQRSGRPYAEVARMAGCAVSDVGLNEASMGIACSDFDLDGLPDIFLTHFFAQKNTLYHNLGGLTFADESRATRIAATSFEFNGFGTAAFDYDRDGAPDLFVANGHVLGPNLQPYEMTPQLLRNDGSGRFDDVSPGAGPYFLDLWLGRGVAPGDYDDDGDVDLAVTHLNKPVALLRNDTRAGRRFIGLDLRTSSRVPPVGGRVVVTAGDVRRTTSITAGGSYLSSGDPRLLIGLPDSADEATVEVFWASGRTERFEGLKTDRYWLILDGGRRSPIPSGGVAPAAPS